MQNYQLKQKRQIEILGLVLSKPAVYKTFDLADIFNCDDITIKRDLRELRSLGIDIHSIPKKGIKIENELPQILIEQLLLQYSIYTSVHKEFKRANHFLVSKSNENALANLTLLQMCVDENTVAKIKYQKPNYRKIDEREIEPLMLYQSENEWRVLAINKGEKKQFLVSRIKSVEITEKKFKSIAQKEIENIFQTSFGSWLGGDKIRVKLLFDKTWKRRKLPQIMANQKSIKNPDGSITFELYVNSLTEIAKWVVGLGKGVVVLEPHKLKEKVHNLASEVLDNY